MHSGPPKTIWLSVGNAGTRHIVGLLRSRADRIKAFADNPRENMLVVQAKAGRATGHRLSPSG